MWITVKHLTLGLVRLVTLNLINKIQDYGWAICSTPFTVTRNWTVTPISFYEIIEFYQNQVSTVAITYVIYLYSPRRKITMIISKISNQTDWISTLKIEIGPVMVKYFELWLSPVFIKTSTLIFIMRLRDFLRIDPIRWFFCL